MIINRINESVSQSFKLVCDVLREAVGDNVGDSPMQFEQKCNDSPVNRTSSELIKYPPNAPGPFNCETFLQRVEEDSCSYETSSYAEVNVNCFEYIYQQEHQFKQNRGS